jgi:hypothetical protein
MSVNHGAPVVEAKINRATVADTRGANAIHPSGPRRQNRNAFASTRGEVEATVIVAGAIFTE